MAMQLRPYQSEAVESVYQHLRDHDDNPCIVIPTAGGKTPVMATICRDAVNVWNGRVLILAHVKELLEQAVDKLQAIAPDLDVGVYSAGLKRRDTDPQVIVAGIQSVYRRACDFEPFDLIIVDEAHLIPPEGDGMYRKFLADAAVVNPRVRVIGLTATPFRMATGIICREDHFLNRVCYEIGVKELIVQGFLSPLRTKAGQSRADTTNLHVRGGEYIAGEVEDLMDEDALVDAACAEIVEQTRDRTAVLIFASGVTHGRHIVRVLEDRHGCDCGFVCGETPVAERDDLLARFKRGGLNYLCNVNVLTTGFDAPNIDCVAMLRPTLSPGLYYQMVGRGFRLHPGKADCLVLDFGGNVVRHGPVDDLRVEEPGQGDGDAPAKECPECQAIIHAAYARCPECGYEFPPPQREQHDDRASTAGVLTGQTEDTIHRVSDVYYSVHTKRGADPAHPRSMRVEYRIGLSEHVSEWICFEHTGYARTKAEQWWRKRSREPVPENTDEAVDICERGSICETSSITVRRSAGEQYDRIVNYELESIPPRLDGSDERDGDDLPEYVFADDEVPF